MFSHRTRTQLPTAEPLLKPETPAHEPTRQQILRRKEKQANYYNQHTKELPPLANGDIVRIEPDNNRTKWTKAQVEAQVDVRSYRVRTEDGRVYRRNRKHLRSSNELFYPDYVLDKESKSQQGSPTQENKSKPTQPQVPTPEKPTPEISHKPMPEVQHKPTTEPLNKS